MVPTVNKVSPSPGNDIFTVGMLCGYCSCFVQQSVSFPLAVSMGHVSSQDTVDVKVAGMEHSVTKVWSKIVTNCICVCIHHTNMLLHLFPVDDCPCRNGECIVDGDNVFCLCHTGWEGGLCDQRM